MQEKKVSDMSKSVVTVVPEKFTCIFGEKIRSDCTVRKEFSVQKTADNVKMVLETSTKIKKGPPTLENPIVKDFTTFLNVLKSMLKRE